MLKKGFQYNERFAWTSPAPCNRAPPPMGLYFDAPRVSGWREFKTHSCKIVTAGTLSHSLLEPFLGAIYS